MIIIFWKRKSSENVSTFKETFERHGVGKVHTQDAKKSFADVMFKNNCAPISLPVSNVDLFFLSLNILFPKI